MIKTYQPANVLISEVHACILGNSGELGQRESLDKPPSSDVVYPIQSSPTLLHVIWLYMGTCSGCQATTP